MRTGMPCQSNNHGEGGKMIVGETSHVVAHAVKLCRPKVFAVYPITPQTHIVEALAEHVANGELDAEIIYADSEHSMFSAIVGAYAAGVRAFTASSSQGLALAHEVLHILSGMRLPAVFVAANRALSAPINIWGDHSDAMTSRDTSVMQFFAKNAQEAHDMVIQAYKIAEQVNLPAMVNIDGFNLSHLYEPVEAATQEQVDSYLPEFKPKFKLDPASPILMGPIGTPDNYMEIKHRQHLAMEHAREIIRKEMKSFKTVFGRDYRDGFVELYHTDRKTVLVAMGTLASTIEDMIDNGADFGLLRIRTFRPFPHRDIRNALKSAEEVVVFDRAYSYGAGGPLYIETKSALYGTNKKVRNAIVGLGGREVSPSSILKAVNSKEDEVWVDNYDSWIA